MVEFTTAQLSRSTVNPIHQFSIADPTYTQYGAVTFDRTGNLWIAEGDPNINQSIGNYPGRILEFSAAQLAVLTSAPNPSPVRTLTTSGGRASALAFDAGGNLWTSLIGFDADTIQEFSPAQIASSGTPTPTVTLMANAGAIAFGSDGTLWYTPLDVFGPSGGYVFGLTPTQLGTSGTPVAAYTLQGDGPEVSAGQLAVILTPDQVTFDGHGNLWSGFNGFYFEFAAATLHVASAVPAAGFAGYPPEASGGQSELFAGYALAFDSANDLVTNSTNNTTTGSNVLGLYTPSQYGAASPTPTTAQFGSSVPAFDGSHFGNYLVSGPYVP